MKMPPVQIWIVSTKQALQRLAFAWGKPIEMSLHQKSASMSQTSPEVCSIPNDLMVYMLIFCWYSLGQTLEKETNVKLASCRICRLPGLPGCQILHWLRQFEFALRHPAQFPPNLLHWIYDRLLNNRNSGLNIAFFGRFNLLLLQPPKEFTVLRFWGREYEIIA